MRMRQTKVVENRIKARKRQAENAEKMNNSSDKRFKPSQVGQTVTLGVPDLEEDVSFLMSLLW